MTYLLLILLMAALLAAQVLRKRAFWLAVVLPIGATTAWWLLSNESMLMWYVAVSLVSIPLICDEIAHENEQRAANGRPTLTKAEIRARCLGR